MATTRSQEIAADVVALLRARNPLIWVTTREEARVERYLIEAAAAAGYVPRTWDSAQGVAELDGKASRAGGQDIGDTLTFIQTRATGAQNTYSGTARERGAWILRDAHAWLNGAVGIQTLRQVRNLARSLPTAERDRAQALIVITPSADIPPELAGHATVIEWPLPDRAEIAALLDAAIEALPEDMKATAAPNGTRDAAIDSAVGLSGEEAQACYAKSLVQLKRIDPAAVAKEKKRVVARERVLEWFDPLPGGLDMVGGLDNLKSWLIARATAYTPKARAYGLPRPKGALLVGISGCGKSLTAKAVATAWGVPLLRLDLGALKSKFVGESEANLRKAFKVIEAIGRCVVWIDEIEKAMQGATSGSADGGVSADALGAVLNWMQERQSDAFILATANSVEQLPVELLRRGRWDELWWIDLPRQDERAAIVAASLKSMGRVKATVDLDAVADATQGYTGAEIAALVPDALFTAFNDGEREVETGDLLEATKAVVPLSKTAAEKITAMRQWADGRARPATPPLVDKSKQSSNRVLDP